MKKEQATTKTKGSRAKSILIGLLSIGAAQLLVAAITGNPPGNVKTTETTYPRMRTQFNDTPRAYTKEEYMEAGIPEEWIEPLKKLGFTTLTKLRETAKAGKLSNDLNGYNKKNKLGLAGLSPQAVEEWLKG